MSQGKYTFYTWQGVRDYLDRTMRSMGGEKVPQYIYEVSEIEPSMPVFTLVETPAHIKGRLGSMRTMTKPFHGADGKWYVFLVGHPEPLPVSSLTVLRASTRVS